MEGVLQQLANEDRLRVKRCPSGHETTILSPHGTTTVHGWLCGQDFFEGWSEKYALWTKEEENGYITISLMIETNIVPDLPEFEGCNNDAVCNLDDFHTFVITLKRECVINVMG